MRGQPGASRGDNRSGEKRRKSRENPYAANHSKHENNGLETMINYRRA